MYIFLYYYNELNIMIRLTIYHRFNEYTFEGEGKLTRIGEVEKSNTTHVKVDFDKSYEHAIRDFLYDVSCGDKCKVCDNENRYFNGEYMTKSRIDGNPILELSKISQYI